MDPYVYPGTNVLKNLRGLKDLESLATFEAIQTSRRLEELRVIKTPGKFDIPHLKAIHGHIFQDVYEWAGQFRTVNIARPGQFFFAYVEQLQFTLTTMADSLRKEQYLQGLDVSRFAERAAFYMGELNAIHPFRDGNGRTQREYIRQLGQHNGYALHWSRVSREEMGSASKRSFEKADNKGLAEVIFNSIQTQ